MRRCGRNSSRSQHLSRIISSLIFVNCERAHCQWRIMMIKIANTRYRAPFIEKPHSRTGKSSNDIRCSISTYQQWKCVEEEKKNRKVVFFPSLLSWNHFRNLIIVLPCRCRHWNEIHWIVVVAIRQITWIIRSISITFTCHPSFRSSLALEQQKKKKIESKTERKVERSEYQVRWIAPSSCYCHWFFILFRLKWSGVLYPCSQSIWLHARTFCWQPEISKQRYFLIRTCFSMSAPFAASIRFQYSYSWPTEPMFFILFGLTASKLYSTKFNSLFQQCIFSSLKQ